MLPWNRNDNNAYFIRLLQELKKRLCLKHLGQCLAYKEVIPRLEDQILAPLDTAYTSDTTAN